jgi:hypothetical protein
MKNHRSFAFTSARAAVLRLICVVLSILPITTGAQGLGSLVVNMTSPTSGSLVRGMVTVSADVTTVGQLTVAGVQFKLDGANLGVEDTAPPYSIPWNTTTASNASHILTAVARDVLGVRYSAAAVTVTVDNIPPSVTVNQSTGQADPTNVSPINFTVAFSEPVTGFTADDVTIAGSAGGTRTVTVTGGPSAYAVAVRGMSTGTVIATIAAGRAHDTAGNPSTASSSTDNSVTFDADAPAVTIDQAASQSDPTSTSPIVFIATFTEPVSDFTAADIMISGTRWPVASVRLCSLIRSSTSNTSGISLPLRDATALGRVPFS